MAGNSQFCAEGEKNQTKLSTQAQPSSQVLGMSLPHEKHTVLDKPPEAILAHRRTELIQTKVSNQRRKSHISSNVQHA